MLNNDLNTIDSRFDAADVFLQSTLQFEVRSLVKNAALNWKF